MINFNIELTKEDEYTLIGCDLTHQVAAKECNIYGDEVGSRVICLYLKALGRALIFRLDIYFPRSS